jgi:hypothetical protein
MIERLCTGRRCLVVGSAPGVVVPPYQGGDITLAANGGAGIVQAAGRVVHVLLTTSYLFRPNPSRQELETIRSMRKLTVESVWVDTKTGPVSQAIQGLQLLGCTWEILHAVNPVDRHQVVEVATGAPGWVSTGVWGVCLAVASGASEVLTAGITPHQVGHAGMPWDSARRDHVPQDAEALRIMGMGP